MRKQWKTGLAAIALGLWFYGDCRAAETPSVAQIRQLLRQCVDSQNRTPGIVVGVIDTNRTNVVACGVRERGQAAKVNGDSIFEIGSITKVFTTTLLQQMVDSGEVKLDDSINQYLPSSVKAPSWHGKEIALLDLATHTSGLPSMPDNLSAKDGGDPWADYTVAQMYDFLSHYKLRRRPGAKFEYSNFGMGLLGHLLALRAGTNYEDLVVGRICRPLGMNSTRITLTAGMKSRLAAGHSVVGPPVKNWNSLALQGDGAFYSSVNDLLKFLAANMGRGHSPLIPIMAKTHVPRERTGLGGKVGLGWMEFSFLGLKFTWHNGGTGGYCSFIGFDPKLEHGAVVLANEANLVDDVGRCLFQYDTYDALDNYKAPKQRTVTPVDHRIYDRYAGRYQFSAKHFLTLTREGERLMAQDSAPLEPPYEIYPESPTEFFLTAMDAQISFVTNQTGMATEAIVHQDGKNQKAKRTR